MKNKEIHGGDLIIMDMECDCKFCASPKKVLSSNGKLGVEKTDPIDGWIDFIPLNESAKKV